MQRAPQISLRDLSCWFLFESSEVFLCVGFGLYNFLAKNHNHNNKGVDIQTLINHIFSILFSPYPVLTTLSTC